MKNLKAEKGFTLIELLIVAVLLVLIGGGIGLMFMQRSKAIEDNELAGKANAAAENAMEVLSNLPKADLQNGGTFLLAGDNEIKIQNKCTTLVCDWLVIPSYSSESPAKGLPYQEQMPDGKTVFFRRWLIEDVDAGLGLKKITVAVLVSSESEQPLAIYSTVVAKN